MFAPFPLEFYLSYKVSTEIQGLSSTDRNFQGLSRCVRTLIGAYGPVKLPYSFTKVTSTMSLFSLVQTHFFCNVKAPEIITTVSVL